MKIPFQQLSTKLSGQLAPVYMVAGDEPFQIDEAVRLIRAAASGQGFTERQLLQAERGFDWSALSMQGNSLSLFAEKKLLELRIPGGKPGKEGASALQAYAATLPEDTLLLIVSGKLDSAQQKSKWFKTLEQAGVFIPVWPVEVARLPQWIEQRLKRRGMSAESEALTLLAERVEGNLLAADQELEKLRLLYGETRLTVPQVQAAVSDSARYDVFSFADAALQGDAERVSRLLFGLRAEGVEAILMLWALHREIRVLYLIHAQMHTGHDLNSAMATQRVWDKRKPLVRAAIGRSSLIHCQNWLSQCAQLDALVKGQRAGRAWDELLELALALAA